MSKEKRISFEQRLKDYPYLQAKVASLLDIIEDALSPNAPHIKDLKKYNLHYILSVKPGDHAFLFETVKTAIQENRALKFACKDKNNSDLIHTFLILNDVPLNKSNQDVRVNFIEYWGYSIKTNKTTYHNSWITDFTLTKENAYTIMRGGRARWKIENETFNTLKNQGYHLGHNFGLC